MNNSEVDENNTANKNPSFDVICSIKQHNIKEDNILKYEIKRKNSKSNKNLFFVNKDQNKEEVKVSNELNNATEKNVIENLNNTCIHNNSVKIEENKNETDLSNNIKIKEELINTKNCKRENKEAKPVDNHDNVLNTTINNNFIINKDNPFLINSKINNSNIINNKV